MGEYDHVAAAAYLMKHARSAALVVLGIRHGGRLVGVITEADIARAVADGMDVNKTRIHDLLTARPAAIPAAASIRDAARTRKWSARHRRRSSASGPAIGARHRPRVHSGVAAERLLHANV